MLWWNPASKYNAFKVQRDKDTRLAFDLQIGPVGDQFWGYYATLQNMESHYMNSWEEMMAKEFFYFPNSIFTLGARPLSLRYMALRKANASADYKAIEQIEEQKKTQRELDLRIERPWRSKKDKEKGKGDKDQSWG